MQKNKLMIQRTYEEIEPLLWELLETAGMQLVSRCPDIKNLSLSLTPAEYIETMIEALAYLVTHQEIPERLNGYFKAFGRRYYQDGLTTHHVNEATDILTASLKDYFGNRWESKYRDLWLESLVIASDGIKQGMEEEACDQPKLSRVA